MHTLVARMLGRRQGTLGGRLVLPDMIDDIGEADAAVELTGRR